MHEKHNTHPKRDDFYPKQAWTKYENKDKDKHNSRTTALERSVANISVGLNYTDSL